MELRFDGFFLSAQLQTFRLALPCDDQNRTKVNGSSVFQCGEHSSEDSSNPPAYRL